MGAPPSISGKGGAVEDTNWEGGGRTIQYYSAQIITMSRCRLHVYVDRHQIGQINLCWWSAKKCIQIYFITQLLEDNHEINLDTSWRQRKLLRANAEVTESIGTIPFFTIVRRGCRRPAQPARSACQAGL